MTTASLTPDAALLEALPFGVALYGSDRRLVHANSAVPRILGLPATSFQPRSSFLDHLRLVAHQGVLGPGDPEDLARQIAGTAPFRERRFRRRHPDGRTFEAHHIPNDGGLVICLTATPAIMAQRDEAERAIARIQNAIGGLQVGFAVFTPEHMLELHNRRFPELVGLPPAALAGAVAPRSGTQAPGFGYDDVVRLLQRRETQMGGEADTLLPPDLLQARQAATLRRERDNGQVVDVAAEPLPDGGWSIAIADVTPMARAEEDARRRAGQLGGILECIPHAVAVFGADQRLLMVNDAYRRLMEGAPGEVGERFADIVRARLEAGEYLEPDPELYVRKLLAIETDPPEQPLVRRRRRPNGRTIDIRTAMLPGGGHVSTITDVTDLAAAQAELAHRADLLSSIVSHVPHGISVYGPDRRLRLVNEAYGRIMGGAPIALGETVDEIIERRARDGEYGPGDPVDLAQRQRRHDNTRPQFRRRRRPNGNVIDVRTAPLPDGSHISVVTDVSALVTAETELAQRAEMLDAMLAHIRHGIVLWGRDRRIIMANSVVSAMLGAPEGLLVPGRALEETIQSALERGTLGEGPTARARARWLTEVDRSQSHLDQRVTRSGRVIEVRSDPTPQGGFVTTYTDVTDVREAEEALLLSKSAAESANAAKSRFLAAMSTELHAPLTAILEQNGALAREAAAQLEREAGRPLTRRALDAARIGEAAAAIDGAGTTLMALIDTILDVTRLESGRFALAEEEVDLAALVRSVLRRFAASAAAAEVALITDLPDTLPAARGDARRLRQTLCHVVSNAVKFTGPMGSVSVGARQDWASGGLVIQVQDTGPGIAEQDIERAFEPFTQLDYARTPRSPGAGLGLYVGRILMRAHGGDLMLRSAPGQGVTATMQLPADRTMDQGQVETN